MFLRFGKAEWDCVTKGNIFMCARYFLCFQVYCLSCRRKLQRYGFQNLILDILYSFKHIWKICLFFLLNIERDEFGLRKRDASPFANPVFTPLSVWNEK